jgi:hypothetical protein
MIHVSGCCNPAQHMQLILSDLFKDFPTRHHGKIIPAKIESFFWSMSDRPKFLFR